MKKRLLWGLGVLLVLLIGVSVVLLTRTTDTEPINIYKDIDPSKPGHQSGKKLAESDKFIEWWEDGKVKLVPDDSQQVEGNMSNGQETDKFPDFNSLTPEQRQHIYNQFYIQCGVPPPPPGYKYRWKDRWVPLLDENGNPVLQKIGDPIVEVQMGIGFAPTLDEFEKYNELDEAWGLAEARGDAAEAKRLKAEMDALEASAQRMMPIGVVSGSIGAEAKSKARSFRKEAYNAALREHGLGHLISPWD